MNTSIGAPRLHERCHSSVGSGSEELVDVPEGRVRHPCHPCFHRLSGCCSCFPVTVCPARAGQTERGVQAKTLGLVRDLNPGPLAPEARIIPLDQQASWCSGPLPVLHGSRASTGSGFIKRHHSSPPYRCKTSPLLCGLEPQTPRALGQDVTPEPRRHLSPWSAGLPCRAGARSGCPRCPRPGRVPDARDDVASDPCQHRACPGGTIG